MTCEWAIRNVFAVRVIVSRVYQEPAVDFFKHVLCITVRVMLRSADGGHPWHPKLMSSRQSEFKGEIHEEE